jgi:50S ribosomal protein L16 3-hydroxylase
MTHDTPLQLLGGLTARQFLRRYWQKKPLLVRQAVPGFTGFAGLETPSQLLELACSPDAESRLVAQHGKSWQLERGPLPRAILRRPRKTPWTVLLQGVNLMLPAGDELLRRFGFIPYTRLDDLMVSYATDGGGVGPHFDSYDVFLLQGMGCRHWQISTQDDHTLVDGLPLRILKHLQVEQEWLLEPGDMLYLPPQCAHNGVARGECMTFSIGFRAPPTQELALQFLTHLQDTLALEGRYADPDLRPQEHAAQISETMVLRVERMLRAIRWQRDDVAAFLGTYLTEPKPHVFFDPPEHPASERGFLRQAQRAGLHLDIRSQMLFFGARFYMNGEVLEAASGDIALLRELAGARRTTTLPTPSRECAAKLHDWYQAGYLHLNR